MYIKTVLWSLIYGLSRIGVVINCPLITAVAWWIALVPLPGVPRLSDKTTRVIILNKVGGTDDVVSAYKNTDSEIDFFLLRRKLLSDLFRYYLSDNVSHYSYRSTQLDVINSKLAYRQYLSRVIKYLNRIWPFTGFISFNVAYAPERELATAMSELAKPFIVCHKECVKTRVQHTAYSNAYRDRVGPYTGSHICVYNTEERESMVRGNLTSPEKITVVGASRLDLSHAIRQVEVPDQHCRTILYYAVFKQAGLPYLDKKWALHGGDESPMQVFDWSQLANMTSEALLDLSEEFPDARIIVKGKQGARYSERIFDLPAPENVDVILGGAGHNYLPGASIVVAFNSASLFEAIAAGKKVVVPMFFPEKIPDVEKFVYELRDAVTLAHTVTEFKSELRAALDGPLYPTEPSDAERDILDRYVGNSDGVASARLRHFIGEALNVSR